MSTTSDSSEEKESRIPPETPSDDGLSELLEKLKVAPTKSESEPSTENLPKTYTYSEILAALKEQCSTIRLSYTGGEDGRITSAVKETEYLNRLESALKKSHPTLLFEHQPAPRWWYDFRINKIPFNLKLTTGGTDNAFNKVAILFTLTGQELTKKNMNYNQFFKTIKTSVTKRTRTPSTEYHYLVVKKDTGEFLIKSILDIHTYKSNPCNDLQINWAHEFKHIDYRSDASSADEKIIELLKTVQTSVKQAIVSMKEFADANLDTLFTP
jgi:hypothetical protein